MEIRKATLSDLDGLSTLFDAYRQFYKQLSDKEAGRQFLKARISKKESEIFVAIDSNGIYAGFVQLYPIFSSTRMQRLWLLNDLFVAPAFRGRDLSKLLIAECKKLAKLTAACGLSLETAKDNTVGNSLYPKVGFELDEAHNFYFWAVPKA